MNFNECLEATRKILALDLACDEADFDTEEIRIFEAKELEGRRNFNSRNPSLNLATFGKGVVISCNAERLSVVREVLGNQTTTNILSTPSLTRMENIVAGDDQHIGGPDLKYLCGEDTLRMKEPPESVEIVVIQNEDEILSLYGDPKFSYALGNTFRPLRPTTLVVKAVCNGETAGMAGVSTDSDTMYQIGINTVPEYQGKGVAGALVSMATKMILEEGKVPYYSTWLNNLASRRLALSVGYKPAWVELYAMNKEEWY